MDSVLGSVCAPKRKYLEEKQPVKWVNFVNSGVAVLHEETPREALVTG